MGSTVGTVKVSVRFVVGGKYKPLYLNIVLHPIEGRLGCSARSVICAFCSLLRTKHFQIRKLKELKTCAFCSIAVLY